MPELDGRMATDRPARYIKQLTSHLGQRLDTSVGPDGVGSVRREDAVATLTPTDDAVLLVVRADTEESASFLAEVVERHLVRFGEADELSVVWAQPQA